MGDGTVGIPLTGWTIRPVPPETPMAGRYTRLERLDPARHGKDLDEVFVGGDPEPWRYLAYGPFADQSSFRDWLNTVSAKSDPLFHAVIDCATGRALGVASLMRIDPANGVIEVGHIHFSPAMKQSRIGTEAIYLLMRRAFDELGYRRFEWKCDALNMPSRRAAVRYGFTYEGTFRQAVVVKARNRDTAWFSIIDGEWPAIKARFEAWLAPETFDAAGRQRHRLQEFCK
jgi:RimJ/RimL family protein N-acetyltransferase